MATIDLSDYISGDELKADYILWKCPTVCGARIYMALGYVVDSLTFNYECPDCALDVYFRHGGSWSIVGSLVCDGTKRSFTVTNGDGVILQSTIRADFKLYRSAEVSPAPPPKITFVTKKEDGIELTGVKVYINGIEKGET